MTETELNYRIMALQNQRNNALNECAMLAAQYAAAMDKISALEKIVAEHANQSTTAEQSEV